jgi:hypothetical protein
MSAQVPLIYAPRAERITLSLPGRALALVISLTCLAVFIAGSQVTPDPSGMGTHLQLNLPPCSFYRVTHLPCPSCGMTTSFAWFFRGNILASLYIQPMGATLALMAVIVFWTGLYIALTARPVYRLMRFLPNGYYIMPLLAWGIAAWAWKIFIHTYGIDGWRH